MEKIEILCIGCDSKYQSQLKQYFSKYRNPIDLAFNSRDLKRYYYHDPRRDFVNIAHEDDLFSDFSSMYSLKLISAEDFFNQSQFNQLYPIY